MQGKVLFSIVINLFYFNTEILHAGQVQSFCGFVKFSTDKLHLRYAKARCIKDYTLRLLPSSASERILFSKATTIGFFCFKSTNESSTISENPLPCLWRLQYRCP